MPTRARGPAGELSPPEKEAVIIQAHEFRLPEVLRHIEAGKTVLVIPAPRRSAESN